jgi:ribosomal protein S18 acetylase RimI-like enzyme
MIELYPVIAGDIPEISLLVEQTSELQVIPTLSSEGQLSMRSARSADILSIADASKYRAVKAVSDDKIIGYVAWRDPYYIAQLYVLPESQNRGVGGALLDAVIARSGCDRLHLRASINAIGFYERCGFTHDGAEESDKGIRYVPMSLRVDSKHERPL